MKKPQKYLFLVLFVYVNVAYAQKFTFICDTLNFTYTSSAPSISILENTFDDYGTESVIKLKQNGRSFEAFLWNKRPVFFQLYGIEILALPNQRIEGTIKNNGSVFIFKDSNNINVLLNKIQDTVNNIKAIYSKGSSFKDFLGRYDSLRNYIAKIINYIGTPQMRARYNLTNEILSSAREFCMSRLAHFSVLPILLHGEYTDKLFNIINSSVIMNNPTYWMQLQAGRIFLRTYFLKAVLPASNYNFEKALSANKMFTTPDIKKYLGYHYFKYIPTIEDNIVSNDELLLGFNKYKNEYQFTNKESKTLEELKGSLSLKGKNIIFLFSKQELTNNQGQALNISEKEGLLKNKGRIIIDYWASWCLPCIEAIGKLESDEITYKGQKCKIIFISIDEKNENWLSKKYPVLNFSNSFRLNNFKTSSFNTVFNLQAIPRLFLIENGFLLNQNFEKERLY